MALSAILAVHTDLNANRTEISHFHVWDALHEVKVHRILKHSIINQLLNQTTSTFNVINIYSTADISRATKLHVHTVTVSASAALPTEQR